MPKYNSIENIPSKVFFDILKSKDYQLLKPKPKEQGLEGIFVQIYDDWFTKTNNSEAKRYLELRNEIGFLNFKIATVKETIRFIYYNPVTESMLTDIVDALAKGCDIIVNIKNNIHDEVSDVLRIQVGSLEFDLFQLQSEFDAMVNGKKGQDIDFYQSIAYLSEILPSNPLLKENMSLAVHVSLENLAKEKIKNSRKK